MQHKYLVAAIACAAVALVFLLVGDGVSANKNAPLVVYLVERYLHGIVWLFLAGYFLMLHMKKTQARYFAYAAVICYVIFLITIF